MDHDPHQLPTPDLAYMNLYHKNLMLSDVGEGSNLMLTRLTPVATLIDTKQQSATTSFNTQIVMFSWHLCNRRDARVESRTYPKRTIIRKKLPAKSNLFALNKTKNTYRLFSSDY